MSSDPTLDTLNALGPPDISRSVVGFFLIIYYLIAQLVSKGLYNDKKAVSESVSRPPEALFENVKEPFSKRYLIIHHGGRGLRMHYLDEGASNEVSFEVFIRYVSFLLWPLMRKKCSIPQSKCPMSTS